MDAQPSILYIQRYTSEWGLENDLQRSANDPNLDQEPILC